MKRRICIVCGKEFETENTKRKMCSEACAKARKVQNVTKARAKKKGLPDPQPSKKQFKSFDDFRLWATRLLSGGLVERYARFNGGR
jgi:hypothetical protein